MTALGHKPTNRRWPKTAFCPLFPNSGHSSALRNSERHVVQYPREPLRVGLDVHHRRPDRGVPRDLGDRLQVDAALGQPRDQRAPPAVRGRAGYPGLGVERLEEPRHRAGRHRAALLASKQRRLRRPGAAEPVALAVLLQDAPQRRRGHEHVARPAALRVAGLEVHHGPDLPGLVVHVGPPQPRQLLGPQAQPERHRQRGLGARRVAAPRPGDAERVADLVGRQHRGPPGRARGPASSSGHGDRVRRRKWARATRGAARARDLASGRLLGLGRAHRLHPRQQVVQLAGLRGADQAVDQRRQLVPRRHGDARLALLELDRSGAVEDREHDAAGTVGAPPGPDPLLLLDLPARVALAGPALGLSDVGGVGQQRLLLLEALDQLGPAVGDGVVGTRGNCGEGEVLQDRHDLSPWLVEIGL